MGVMPSHAVWYQGAKVGIVHFANPKAIARPPRFAQVVCPDSSQPEIRVAFKIQNLSVDLVNNTANFAAFDQPTTPGALGTMIQGNFPFTPTGGESHEHDKVLAAAKAALQRCLNEI